MSSDPADLATKSAAAIGREIEAGRADPRALTEMYLERAASATTIYAHVTADRARREAQSAWTRAQAGLRRGPLDGVPISWKDLFDVAGAPTEAGSLLLTGAVADADAAVVRRAARAGLICLGKTHLSELAFSGLGYNPRTATAPNAFDLERVPGGSSSGAAASVALGSAAAAVGSDTGGSVRIPAAWNGLVGLKTSLGAIAMEGVRPLSPSLDTIGPLTRTVEDAALMLCVLQGGRPPALEATALTGVRLLAPTTVMQDALAAPVAAAFEASLTALAAAGATIVEAPVPEFAETNALIATHGSYQTTEAYGIWRDRIEADPDAMLPDILVRFRAGADLHGWRTDFARLEILKLRRALADRLAGFDALVAPTAPNEPPRVDAVASDPAVYAHENMMALRNTRLGNLLDLAAISLPTRRPAQAVAPGALMLAGPAGSERRLLRLAAAVEAAGLAE